ncbi:Man1-Src1p-C-terminal domain-containing protein [Fomitopsis serialis]|uniref:Man1-Src1p-C-terminal domain-containing protein n=1 Tax=Fomitopsis serialis TaxID=139415 RepID=UPI0020089648|nr:Man1-Src1p-C-terminal domain-containing protein [Neoantrodia serialis]KAH9917198.1 Man1-Src1p-C-terminal domain-containing protein [Neoantrodia serialis]
MSRPTSADVIATGAYLQPGFDANRLTMAQLRSLVQLFDAVLLSRVHQPAGLDGFAHLEAPKEPPTQPVLSHPMRVGEESPRSGARSPAGYGQAANMGQTSTQSGNKSATAPRSSSSREYPGPIGANVFQRSARSSPGPEASGPRLSTPQGTLSSGPQRLDGSGWINDNIFQTGSKRSPDSHHLARRKTNASLHTPSGPQAVADSHRKNSGWINDNVFQSDSKYSPGPRRKTGASPQAVGGLQTVVDGHRGSGSMDGDVFQSGAKPSPVPHSPPDRPKNSGLTNEAPRTRIAQSHLRESHTTNGIGADEAQRFGMPVYALESAVEQRIRASFYDLQDPLSPSADVYAQPEWLPMLHEVLDELIKDPSRDKALIVERNIHGELYIAHRQPHLTWACMLKLKVGDAWTGWKRYIITGGLAVVGLSIFKRRQRVTAVETDRVTQAVETVFAGLKNQSRIHNRDPTAARAAQRYLVSLHMRDDLLQDMHSVAARQRIWTKVERIVEANANVRTSLEETDEGEEMRVWRWLGSFSD